MAAERAAEGRDAMQFGFLAIWKQISRYLVGHISDWKNKLGVASSQHKYDFWQALQFTCSAELHFIHFIITWIFDTVCGVRAESKSRYAAENVNNSS